MQIAHRGDKRDFLVIASITRDVRTQIRDVLKDLPGDIEN
jgi:hypothetical protein